MKSLGIRKLIKYLKRALLKHMKKNHIGEDLPCKVDEQETVQELKESKLSPVTNLGPEVSEQYMLKENFIPSYSDMITSTPMKLKYLRKIIILHDVSDLKIYEDVEEIKNADISAVTCYESVEEEEERIYENIIVRR